MDLNLQTSIKSHAVIKQLYNGRKFRLYLVRIFLMNVNILKILRRVHVYVIFPLIPFHCNLFSYIYLHSLKVYGFSILYDIIYDNSQNDSSQSKQDAYTQSGQTFWRYPPIGIQHFVANSSIEFPESQVWHALQTANYQTLLYRNFKVRSFKNKVVVILKESIYLFKFWRQS